MLDKGTKVRVLGGALTGKVGVISELDGKGSARVALGLMSAWVALDDLRPAAEVELRPALRSSHFRLGANRTTAHGKPEPAPAAAPAAGRSRSAPPVTPGGRPRSEAPPEPGGVHPGASRSKKSRPARRGPAR